MRKIVFIGPSEAFAQGGKQRWPFCGRISLFLDLAKWAVDDGHNLRGGSGSTAGFKTGGAKRSDERVKHQRI